MAMYKIHYHNDFIMPIHISSSDIDYISFYTRDQGTNYCCSYDNQTLYVDGDYVYAILNNHNLEPGTLSYTVEYEIPDSNYPDGYQKVCKHYTTDIVLTKDNGDLTINTINNYLEQLKELND